MLTIKRDPLYKEAIAHANGLANKFNENKISLAIMLAAIAIVIEKNSLSLPKKISSKKENIKQYLKKIEFLYDEDIEAIPEEKPFFEDDLKGLLKNSYFDFSNFIEELLKFKRKCISTDDPKWRSIFQHATLVALFKKRKNIGFSDISAGAYYSFINGQLKDETGISAHIIANKKYFEQLIQMQKLPKTFAGPDSVNIYSFSDKVSLYLQKEANKNANILTLINEGIVDAVKSVMSEHTSYHEAGHAVVSMVLRPDVPVTKVSIIPDQGYSGVTCYDMSSPSIKLTPLTRKEFDIHVCTALAGRSAELIKFGFGEVDTGAQSDLDKATDLSWHGVAVSGLDDEFGPVNLDRLRSENNLSSGYLFDLAQKRVREILKNSEKKVLTILEQNWQVVEKLTLLLKEKKEIYYDDVMNCFIVQGLSNTPGVIRARSLQVKRNVVIAKKSGLVTTPEGSLRFQVGDAIITDENNDCWPVKKRYFNDFYIADDSISHGDDGTYLKRSNDVLVYELKAPMRINFSEGRGGLYGRAGDWIVDYGNGELSIVAREKFLKLYELIKENSEDN